MKRWLARVHPFVWIGAVAAVAGLIAWPLGGWDTVELQSTKIPDAAAGQVVKGHQFSVALDSAEITDVNPNGFEEPPAGWEYLVLTVEVTNETAKTELSGDLGDNYFGVVTLDEGALGWGSTALDSSGYDARADPYLVSDGTFLPDLQPRLPTELVLSFEVPVGQWTPGDELTIGIVDRFPYDCSFDIGTCYGQPAVIAHVPLTLEQGEVAPTAEPDDGGFS